MPRTCATVICTDTGSLNLVFSDVALAPGLDSITVHDGTNASDAAVTLGRSSCHSVRVTSRPARRWP